MKKTLLALTLTASILMFFSVSCKSPMPMQNLSSPAGGMTISFGGSSRTVVAGWESQVTSYIITITSRNGHATQSKTETSSGVVTFPSLEPGSWDVGIVASGPLGPIGAGTSLNNEVSAYSSSSIAVELSSTQTGTGGYSFTFAFPAATGIDSVVVRLYGTDDVALIQEVTPTLVTSGSLVTGTVAGSGIPSGIHRLALAFFRGGLSAGVFCESVNVWDNVTSAQWVGADGFLHSQRTLEAAEFVSTDVTLDQVSLASNSIPLSLSPEFSPGTTNYTVVTGTTLTLTHTGYASAQTIELQQNTTLGPWTSVGAGYSVSLAVSPGSIFYVRVTAGNRSTRATYTITTVSDAHVLYYGNGADGGTAPIDSTVYSAGSPVAIPGNPNGLTKAGSIHCGWNTRADGTGTNYPAGDLLPAGSPSLVLYAVWLPSSRLRIDGTGVFQGTTKPTGDLIIPDGITIIYDNSFSSCPGLTSITIPSSLVTIGARAFQDCPNLRKITVAASNPAFSSLDGVLFNKTKSTLLAYPMGNTRGLYSIPSETTTVRSEAFIGCRNLVGMEILGAKTVESRAFANCTNLVWLRIGFKAIIGDFAFQGCTRLTDLTFAGSTNYGDLISLGYGAFQGCTGLTSVTISASVRDSGFAAFSGCTGLTSVVFATGVRAIGNQSFYGCTSLSTITIPSSVTSVGSQAFFGCTNLSTLICNPTTPPSMPSGSQAFDNTSPSLQIKVPFALIPAYGIATGWMDYWTKFSVQ